MFSLQQKKVLLPVLGVSLSLGLIGQVFPAFLGQFQYFILAVLTLGIGLPHGATDYLLYQRLHGKRLNKAQILKFFVVYLSAVAAYFCAWMAFPLGSFVLFLLISTYHFGQSNWEQLAAPAWLKCVVYILWGACVLGGSVLWHWDQSQPIIAQLVPGWPQWSTHATSTFQFGLLGLNILLIASLWWSRLIDAERAALETLKLLVLSFMLFFTPLLVGFAIYFTLWHSLGSLLNQIKFFRLQWPTFTVYQYYRQATPYTLLALVGLLGMVVGQSYWFPNVSLLSIFLVFISCLTLPHIFLIEESYK